MSKSPDMEFESEARVFVSPGAGVVIGSGGWPPFGAALVGFVAGLAFGLLACRGWRRQLQRRELGRQRTEATGAPLRMPGDNPDVETEL